MADRNNGLITSAVWRDIHLTPPIMQNANLVKCNPSYNSSSSFKSTNLTGLFYVQFTLMNTERTRLIKIISLRLTGLQRKGKNISIQPLLTTTHSQRESRSTIFSCTF